MNIITTVVYSVKDELVNCEHTDVLKDKRVKCPFSLYLQLDRKKRDELNFVN